MGRPGTSLTDTAGDPALFQRNLFRRVLVEVRWSFTWPCNWLLGVALNLALSLLWLIWVPQRGGSHSDPVILVGTYFAVFILADVTTTNVLGLDAMRVHVGLKRGVPIRRMLLTKNYALLVIIGIPTLVLTAILTVRSELPFRLALTLPGVGLPILAWLGVGNVISVLLPVAIRPVRTRWEQRRQFLPTARWLAHLALPYALLYAVDPVGDTPHWIFRQLPRHLHNAHIRGLLDLLTGLVIWLVGTAVACWIVRRRGLRMH